MQDLTKYFFGKEALVKFSDFALIYLFEFLFINLLHNVSNIKTNKT